MKKRSVAKPAKAVDPFNGKSLREYLEDPTLVVRRGELLVVVDRVIDYNRLERRRTHWYWRAIYVIRGYRQRAVIALRNPIIRKPEIVE